MKYRVRYSIRFLLMGIVVVSCSLAWLNQVWKRQKLERQAAELIESRAQSAALVGDECSWPWSVILGKDYYKHVRGVQIWNYHADMVDCLEHMPMLESVHIDEDPTFRKGGLDESSFRSLRGHRYVDELYISAPMWDDRLLEHFYAPTISRLVIADTNLTGKGLRHLRPDKLETLSLAVSPIDDKGIEAVTRLHELKNLYIGKTNVTDRGIQKLESLEKLKVLVLLDLNLTDNGFAGLPPNLERLIVGEIPISDDVIEHISSEKLQEIYLVSTEVTAQGIERLKQINPGCKYLVEKRYKPVVPPTLEHIYLDTVFSGHPGVGLAREFSTSLFDTQSIPWRMEPWPRKEKGPTK